MWAKQKEHAGFTIVELLIVIVVIAILAAITVVAYNGIQHRSADSAVISDLASLKKKIELYKVDNNDLYPAGAGQSTLTPLGFKASKGAYAQAPVTDNNLWYCRNSTQLMYSVVALSKSGKVFYISETKGPTEYTGAATWSSTAQNCDAMVNPNQGWQYAGYASADTTGGPWRTWVGGN